MSRQRDQRGCRQPAGAHRPTRPALANAITVTPGGGLAGFTTTQVGVLQDAQLTVDGFDVTSASNTITGAITGVTLELQAVGSSTVSFSGDSSLLEDGLNEFVNAYNGLRGNIKRWPPPPCAGDSVLLGLERSINQRLTSTVNLPDSSTAHLFEAGVSFTDQGDLSLNAATLAESVAADPTRMLDLFGADGALGVEQLDSLSGQLPGGRRHHRYRASIRWAARDRILDRQIEHRIQAGQDRGASARAVHDARYPARPAHLDQRFPVPAASVAADAGWKQQPVATRASAPPERRLKS